MEQIMCGMLARSKAGHDAKTLYLVCRTEGDFVYLCDGRLRKFDSPKKKNKKHIQIIHKIPEALENWNGEALRDEKITARTDFRSAGMSVLLQYSPSYSS